MPCVRPYCLADRTSCVRVFESNVPDGGMLPEETEMFCADLESGDLRYFVVEDDSGAIVGSGGYDAPAARLCWFVVDLRRQREGLGSLLLEECLTRMRQELGDVPFYLDTSQHGREFYARRGFRVVSEERNSYAPGLDRYDMVLEPDSG